MVLREWVEKKGRGELWRLHKECKVAYSTIYKLYKGGSASYATASVVSAATGGVVSIAELCNPPENSRPFPDLKGGGGGGTGGRGGGGKPRTRRRRSATPARGVEAPR